MADALTGSVSPPLGLEADVALVLSGGAARGSIQAGMLRAVVEAGIRPRWIVATSVGALNAAFMARSWSVERVMALWEVWEKVNRDDVFGAVNVWTAFRYWATGSLSDGSALDALIERMLPATYAELEIPVFVVTTALRTGAAKVFSAGDLRAHVRASASIPFVFPPVTLPEAPELGPLVDGGLVGQVPLAEAARLRPRAILVGDVGEAPMPDPPPTRGPRYAQQIIRILRRAPTKAQVELLAEQLPLVFLPAPGAAGASLHEFDQTPRLMAAAYAATTQMLAAGGFEECGLTGEIEPVTEGSGLA